MAQARGDTYRPCRDGPIQHKGDADDLHNSMNTAPHTADNLIIFTTYEQLPPGWQLDVAVLSEWGH